MFFNLNIRFRLANPPGLDAGLPGESLSREKSPRKITGADQMSAREFKEGDLALTRPLEVIVIESQDPDNCHQCGEGIEAGVLCGYHEERSQKFCLNCLEGSIHPG